MQSRVCSLSLFLHPAAMAVAVELALTALWRVGEDRTSNCKTEVGGYRCEGARREPLCWPVAARPATASPLTQLFPTQDVAT